MAAPVLQRLTLYTIRRGNSHVTAQCWGTYVLATATPQPALAALVPRLPALSQTRAFSMVQDAEEAEQKKAKPEPGISSVGRKIGDRIVRLLDEAGNDLGTMHRANVIKLMNQRGLLLVKRNASAQPPEYQLMTGLQIREERLRLHEQHKAQPKAGPTVTKELTFSSNIGRHDLDTKSKQIQQWIEKNHRVQITVKRGKNTEEPDDNKIEAIFNHILQTMPGMATFSKPQAVRGGKAMMCVLRRLSIKEQQAYQGAQSDDNLNKEQDKGSQPGAASQPGVHQ